MAKQGCKTTAFPLLRPHDVKVESADSHPASQGSDGFEAPILGDQHDWYLMLQLQNFRAGIKGTHKDDEHNHVTRPMTLVLNDENINGRNLYYDAGFQLR
ncbi:MAG: hypothetical protein IIB71_15415 [Proteobacteria bacterium]|nr:hypothetical protein [Pseudomonadota bacterium]